MIKKITKLLLALSLLLTGVMLTPTKINAQEVGTYAVVSNIPVTKTKTQYYTEYSSLTFAVTVTLNGSYRLTKNGTTTSISNINISPSVSYAPLENSYNMTAVMGKMEKTVNASSIDVKVTILLYKNGTFEDTMAFEFTV